MLAKNLIYDNEIMEEVRYQSWHEFVQRFESFDNKNHNFLFRGQSNFQGPLVKKEWNPYGLLTTLQRSYEFADYMDIRNTLDAIIERKTHYKCLSGIEIENIKNHLPIILYLRHAGVPMPVLDMTFDPITALYFAAARLALPYGVQDGVDKNDNRYISIYQFDKSLLIEHYEASEISELTYFSDNIHEKILLITETGEIPYPNGNMIKQQGAFLFFNSSHSIDTHINYLKTTKSLPKPIKHHKIPYYSIFLEFVAPPEDDIFRYLVSKNKVGHQLFDDEQALLYDFICPP